MKFSEALNILDDGGLIKHKNWREDHYLFKNNEILCVNYSDGIKEKFHSSLEYFSDNWEIYEKTYSFLDALKNLKDNQKMYRPEFGEEFYISLVNSEAIHSVGWVWTREMFYSEGWVIKDHAFTPDEEITSGRGFTYLNKDSKIIK